MTNRLYSQFAERKLMRISKLKFMALCMPFLLTGCLYHTRRIQQPVVAGPVLDSDAEQLIDGVNRRYREVNSLTARVEFEVSVGGARKGTRTDYSSIRGFILFRKPEMLRVVGEAPLVFTRIFDLASDGTTFTLQIPAKDRAIEGSNRVTRRSANPLENLRPDIFLESILVRSISPDHIVTLIHESSTSLNPKTKRLVETPEYDLSVLSPAMAAPSPGDPQVAKPLRVIRFSRLNLLPIELDIYDRNAELETQVLYGAYQDYNGIQYPTTIDINRPLDELRVKLTVEKLILNQPLEDNQFALRLPADVKVEHLK